MRRNWFTLVAVLCVVGCSTPPPGTSSPSASNSPGPDNIARLRSAFPPDFEVQDIGGPGSPVTYWGIGDDWSADPSQCAELADPIGNVATVEGLSGSGPGGIVYVVVAAAPSSSPGVLADCGQFTVTSPRSTATVEAMFTAPIDGVATVGMATATRTVVEGGTETDSRAQTATAYLGDQVAFVVVVTDPGSVQPQLPPEFATALLAQTVATLRG